ncbi:MAG: ABC transporter substrate-binding protein [Thermoprotei archaeon]|nr:MAG: ABC transporter substrate-binding protein [Thermoprotei archaeon]RLE56765.1 MAG: ABC transporter substrate-binding protein [Thermoprotei archaeon]
MRSQVGISKWVLVTILVVVIVAIVAAVITTYLYYSARPSKPTAPPPPTKPTKPTKPAIVIKDFRGKTIELAKPAERVVVLQSYWAEVIVALGKANTIVGVGSYVPYDEYLPPEVRDLPKVGSIFRGVNVEAIASLKPDVVIMDFGYGKADEIIKKLEQMGIPVIGLFIRGIEDEIKAIEILGKVLGAEEKAKKLIEFIKTRYGKLKELGAKVPESKRLKVVFISGSSVLKGGALSLYANASWGRAVEDIGAVNVALHEFPNKKWPKVDFETLVKWDPDVVFITSSVKYVQKVLDKVASDTRWHVLKAYKSGRIYVVPCWGSIGGVLDWGPRDIIGREYIAKLLYPDVYREVDWRGDMEYLLEHFYGIDIPKQAFAAYSIEWKEIVDPLGNVVKVPRKVKKVVDLISYLSDLALGVMDRLVGVSKYAKKNPVLLKVYPKIKDIPSPGSSFKVNIEVLEMLRPDVVIIWPYKPSVVEQIEKLGIPVVKVHLYSYDDVRRLLWCLGVLYGVVDRVKKIINDMDNLLMLVRERIKDIPSEKRVRVLYLWSKPTRVQGGRGTMNDAIVLAGGVNVAAKEFPDKSYVTVDFERIVKWNPDMIVIWWWAKYGPEDLLKDPKWSVVKAVKEGRVYKEPYYEHWGPDLTLFVLWLACKMYPDRFSDINFMEIANKYYMEWYGILYSEVASAG